MGRSFPQPVSIVSESDLVNPMLRVGDLATKGVRVCDRKLPVIEAVRILADCESGLLPVVDAGKPVGVLSERDVVAAMGKAGTDFYRLPVDHVMSSHFCTIHDNATLDELFECCGARGTLVVGRDGRLQGIIYWRNLIGKLSRRGLGRMLLRVIERERRARSQKEPLGPTDHGEPASDSSP